MGLGLGCEFGGVFVVADEAGVLISFGVGIGSIDVAIEDNVVFGDGFVIFGLLFFGVRFVKGLLLGGVGGFGVGFGFGFGFHGLMFKI